jgi:pimeloyl-ACP methyl ester carboxylesterase
VRRGYIACIYHATDPRYGNGDDSDAWIEVYPEYDFSVLARWAWAASRAVDYLVTLPEVDKQKIGLAGHSRNGKQALLAAAFDERIGAVIPSSGNSGEVDPWRYTTEAFANESIEFLAGVQSHWFHPRLRFFSGREDKLPVDQNSLLALVAPRGLMLYSGYAESAGNPFGFEQAYRSALSVYRFLGKPENVWLHLRNGEHDTTAGDVENFIDFFDAVFGRRAKAKSETWVHGYTFDEWKRLSGETINPLAYPERRSPARQELRKRLEWAIGEEPAGVPAPRMTKVPKPIDSAGGWLEGLFRRPSANPATRARVAEEGMGWAEIPFGDGLKADLFFPAGKPEGPWPVVIWLHGYSYQNGWSVSQPWTSTGNSWRLDQRPSFPSLVKRGFAVLTFDQLGFGTRVLDARDFYRRYPHWSLMGKMVSDTRAAIDAVEALETVDPKRIYLMGYSLGAKVGLMTAALDGRVRGLAAVGGYDPLRLSTPEKGVEGIRHYSHLHGLMPRLGFFADHPRRLPFDFDDTLALILPRDLLIVSPEHDRYARVADVRSQVNGLRARLGNDERDHLKLETPPGFNAFGRVMQEKVFDWLHGSTQNAKH